MQVLFELENKAGTGATKASTTKSASLRASRSARSTVTFPIAAGFGSNDFYGSLNQSTGLIDDEAFGFVSGGVTLSYTLPSSPSATAPGRSPRATPTTTWATAPSDFNTVERGGVVRDDNEHEHVFSGGLMVAF